MQQSLNNSTQKVMQNKLKIGHSPLSNTISIGTVDKDGQWNNDRADVTIDALVCTALYAVALGEPVIINKEEDGKETPVFTIRVEKH